MTEWDEIAKKHNLTSTSPGTKYYEPILDQFKKMLEAHPNPTSVTFCWMQGERDAKEKLSAAYEDALTTLIANLRRDLKQPKMNFVIGRLSDFSTRDHWNAVRAAQLTVAKNDKRGAWVDCDDLTTKRRTAQNATTCTTRRKAMSCSDVATLGKPRR